MISLSVSSCSVSLRDVSIQAAQILVSPSTQYSHIPEIFTVNLQNTRVAKLHPEAFSDWLTSSLVIVTKAGSGSSVSSAAL